ncbi:COP9 signalosome complex subunit 1-like [Artemia franciscana]
MAMKVPFKKNFKHSDVRQALFDIGQGMNYSEPMQIDLPPEEANDNANLEEYPIVENPTIPDLESYANSYTGQAKILRLMYIADHCTVLRKDALKLAIAHIENTYNTHAYKVCHDKLAEALGGERPDADTPVFNSVWYDTQSKKAALKLEKLDSDLKNHKANSIKESIRRGQEDLAEHHLDCGNYHDALKAFSRARDYCISSKHIVDMCLNVIKVSIYLKNWTHVLTYFTKAEAHSPPVESLTKLECASALAEMALQRYKQAALHFLRANIDHSNFPDIMTPSNVATYGTLCALATFNREELQNEVISSSSFKLFLEQEPALREVATNFFKSKYDTALKILEDIKDNLLLDMYLAPHVNSLYAQIRSRALIQYFRSYSSADLRIMASAFNTTVSDLQLELIPLIQKGQISARINSEELILKEHVIDERVVTFETTREQGREYQRLVKVEVMRALAIKHGICVTKDSEERKGLFSGNSVPEEE